MDEKRRHLEPTVTDSSSKVEKGGHSVNESEEIEGMERE